MNQTDELDPDDPLVSLLDTYAVEGSDVEERVLQALAREQEQEALRFEVAQLRTEVAAMREEMAAMRRLLAQREVPRTPFADTTRGKPLLPYVHNDDFSLLPGHADRN